jgi:hypothetical protein
MPRTSPTLVQGLTEVDASVSLTPFIDTANTLVTEFCTGVNGPTPAYDTDRLELIERWLSAHFYRLRDLIPVVERAGSVAEHKQYKMELALNQTPYGQHAMFLDTNGGLAAWNDSVVNGKPRRVGVTWLGSSPEPTYEERNV